MGCSCCSDDKEYKEYTGKRGNEIENQKLQKNNKKNNKIFYKKIEYDERQNKIDKNKLKDLEINSKTSFIREALERNNIYRMEHKAEPLALDDYLMQRAFILAKQFLIEGTYDNEDLLYSNHQELGMNVLLSEEELTGKQLIDKWYEESIEYNYREPKELYECNNFTQMIWRKSKFFGVGYYCLENKIKKENYKSNNTNIKETNEKSNFKKENIQREGNNANKNPEKIIRKYYYVGLYYPSGNRSGEYKSNVLKKQRNILYHNEVNKVEEKIDNIKNNSIRVQVNNQKEKYDNNMDEKKNNNIKNHIEKQKEYDNDIDINKKMNSKDDYKEKLLEYEKKEVFNINQNNGPKKKENQKEDITIDEIEEISEKISVKLGPK